MKTCYVDFMTRSIVDLYETIDRNFVISRINVPKEHRGRGVASKLLRQVIEEADREGVTLRLIVSPSGGLGYDALVAWYNRLGFREGFQPGFLVRNPRGER